MSVVSSLEKTLASLRSREKQLGQAQRAYAANRKRAFKAHAQQKAAEETADKVRVKNPDQAARKDQKASRLRVVAYRNHVRAQDELGRVKRLSQKINKLELQRDELEERLHKVTIVGNKATGGTDWDRWMAVQLASVANCASGKRRNFYSMPGRWDVDHPIVPGEEYGERSDCSQTIYAWIKAAGLPDPRSEGFTGGYTGTLAYPHSNTGWKQVSRETFYAKNAPGYIIYGSGTGHHVEGKCPSPTNRERTAGHGSAPVDFGTDFLFGNGEYQRYYLYLPE